MAYLPDGPPLAVANFGLLLNDGAAGWQFVCDDVYGTPPPELVRVDGRGRLFAAAAGGLRRSTDGCTWELAGGDLIGLAVLDLAFDPGASDRMWALAGPERDRVLALSSDGGATFQVVHRFGDGPPYAHLLVAPSDPRRMYATAGTGTSSWLSVSSDGGATWSARDLAAGMDPPPQNPFALMAIAPADPDRLYFSLVDAYGDELWLSEDGGRSLRRVLKGGARDWMSALAFGTGDTVYAGAAVVPVLDGAPPGHLYVSPDGGKTWGSPIDAGPDGPTFRCLRFAEGKLYACAGETFSPGSFLVGASEDSGHTWRPILGLRDLTGVKSCARPRCSASEAWLCDVYGHCPAAPPDAAPSPADPTTDAGPPDGPPPDASKDTAPAPPSDAQTPPIPTHGSGGCSCDLARAPGGPTSALPLMLLTLPLLLRRRRLFRMDTGVRRRC